jgi:mRNA-degrading endonuclease toxin of MazEF toxin-antitoxin module
MSLMTKPAPEPGLVVRYDYLWRREARQGRSEGSKHRPCVVVLAGGVDRGRPFAVVAPVTHIPPEDPASAVEIPAAVKRWLGLDEARSWIVTSELNRMDWSDAGLMPVQRGIWTYGFLPRGLLTKVLDQIRGRLSARLLPVTSRSPE